MRHLALVRLGGILHPRMIQAFVEVAGQQMVVRVHQALSGAGITPVVAIGGDRERLETVGIESITDTWPGEGPLGGILTAVLWSAAPRICIVACDLAILTSATITSLVDVESDAAVVVAMSDRLEPLCAVWRCDEATKATLSGAFAAGERSVERAMGALRITTVDVVPADLSNFNAPHDLA